MITDAKLEEKHKVASKKQTSTSFVFAVFFAKISSVLAPVYQTIHALTTNSLVFLVESFDRCGRHETSLFRKLFSRVGAEAAASQVSLVQKSRGDPSFVPGRDHWSWPGTHTDTHTHTHFECEEKKEKMPRDRA